jgi:hypothetical protein
MYLLHSNFHELSAYERHCMFSPDPLFNLIWKKLLQVGQGPLRVHPQYIFRNLRFKKYQLHFRAGFGYCAFVLTDHYQLAPVFLILILLYFRIANVDKTYFW